MGDRQNEERSRIVRGNNLKFKGFSSNGHNKRNCKQLYIIQPQLNKKQFLNNKGKETESDTELIVTSDEPRPGNLQEEGFLRYQTITA